MLKSFINAKTGEKVRLSKGEHDKSKLEEELGMEVKGDGPLIDTPKKRGRPKKEEALDTNNDQ